MNARGVLRALLEIENELPDLVGKDWPQLVVDLRRLIERIGETNNEKLRVMLAGHLLRALKPYGAATERLNQAMQVDIQRRQDTTRGSGPELYDSSELERFSLRTWFEVKEQPMVEARPEATGKLALPCSVDGVPSDEDEELYRENEQSPGNGWADEPSETSTERQINTWISERQTQPRQPFICDEVYTLNLQVGSPRTDSLTTGADAAVSKSSVPASGLLTRWVIVSDTVELRALNEAVQITTPNNADAKPFWQASFELLIPPDRDSEARSLQIIPRGGQQHGFEIFVYSPRELYRQLSVSLSVTDEPVRGAAAAMGAPLSVERDVALAPAAHLNLRTTHEWTTPPGVLDLTVIGGGRALVNGTMASPQKYLSIQNQLVDWFVQKAVVAGTITNVRAALERLRANHENYFNDISPDDLAARLQQLRADPHFARPYDWSHLGDFADAAHQQQWDAVSKSNELRVLAYEGHSLYESFFPSGTELRQWLDELQPGHRLNIAWHDRQAGDWLPHIPWGLMYLPDLPAAGQPIDATGFWGLRFRTEYQAHAGAPSARNLGGLADARRLHFLYWGGQANDATATEARWQQQQFTAWQNQAFVPAVPSATNPKDELLQLLDAPSPPTTTLLYLYCQSSVGNGSAPVLRFGSTNAATDVLNRTELSTRSFADRPLVFANACTTSTADAYTANELELNFFKRGCRAFIGTESKVPIQLASRFAALFFQFFYRQIDAEPMAAGEALAQTRLQLWQQYRNIGGLFYSYVNAYDLFMADDAEVRALRN